MANRNSILRPLLTVAATLCLMATTTAQAGEFYVTNCSNRAVGVTVESYNSTDLLKFSSYNKISIPQNGTGVLRCNTPQCAFKTKYPKEVSETTSGGMVHTQDILKDYFVSNFETTNTRKYFCLSMKYNSNGHAKMPNTFMSPGPCQC